MDFYAQQASHHTETASGHPAADSAIRFRSRTMDHGRRRGAAGRSRNFLSGPQYPFIEIIAWTAGFISGLFSLIMASVMPNARRRQGSWALRSRQASAQGSIFLALYGSILGHTKRQIASVLGPPPASGIGPQNHPASPPVSTGTNYWQANTWYYPFNRNHRTAIAVLFKHDCVAKVEFIDRLT